MNSSLTAQNQTAFMNSLIASNQAAFSSVSRGKRRARTPLRHRRVLRDNLMGISKADIRRLARRGGVKRLSSAIYPEMRDVLKNFLQRIIGTAIVYTEYASRKTVTVHDIIYSLKHEGRTMYGYDSGHVTRPSKSPRMVANTRSTIPLYSNSSIITAIQIQSPTVDTASQPKSSIREKIVSRKESH